MDKEEFDRAIGERDSTKVNSLLYEMAKIIAANSCRKRDLREDLAQDIWIHLASKTHHVDPVKGSAWHFLYKCGMRYAWKRTGRKKRGETWLGEIEIEAASLSAGGVDRESALDAREAIAELRKDARVSKLLDALEDETVMSGPKAQNRVIRTRVCPSLGMEEVTAEARRRVGKLFDRAQALYRDHQRRLSGYEAPMYSPTPMLKPSEFSPLPVAGPQLSFDWSLSAA